MMVQQETITSAQYQAKYGKKPLFVPSKPKSNVMGRPKTSQAPGRDELIVGEGFIRIVLVGLFPGINGSNGLKREHWASYKKRKENIILRLSVLRIPRFSKKVSISLEFHHSILADEDSLTSRFKIIGDCLVKLGILIDDSPKYVSIEKPQQMKSRRKEQKLIIGIKPME